MFKFATPLPGSTNANPNIARRDSRSGGNLGTSRFAAKMRKKWGGT
ncbi:hypothetical protein RESH_02488 [Rhodopirellula europaea SH398]|uniref:Uncharacterized protein n=1 Tax=Rhodopirellula europaea SH398 TaxID=1263868 RepID=M5S635_9BACT|nr:hypothetical protein RESH_02488 [Rhodopirellula europaea SH398]